MAKRATAPGGKAGGSKAGTQKRSSSKNGSGGGSRSVAAKSAAGDDTSRDSATEAFLKLLQSPIVADLLAVAAMAALAALAEHGFGSRTDKGRAKTAMKAAGKAAAAAVGRRLATEVQEIRNVAKARRAEAK
jgi:hypothetical protein